MRLHKFKDIHKGERAFIVACGPSLKDIDLSLLDNEIVFGVSLAYKSRAKIDYHFMGDYNIASQFWQDMFYLPFDLFVSKSIMLEFFLDRPKTWYFRGHEKNEKEFKTDLSNGRLYGGGTSTFLAMQFAYFMGIEKVYVIGLDHYKSYDKHKHELEDDLENTGVYNRTGMPLVITKTKDKHHFTEDFYKKGTKYYLPTVDKMANSYLLANKAYWETGREIWNASTETALPEHILPRCNFEEII